jgi:predicted nucleic acid-binding protein
MIDSMTTGYLFDTGFLTSALTDSLPEKWIRPWNEIIKRGKAGYIIEPVIAETCYQLMTKKGINKEMSKNHIMRIKSLDSMNILNLNDNDSFKASLYRTRFSKFSLSLVDCFILATANRLKLKVYTTDEPLKRVAKKINVSYNYLPIRS